MAQLEARYAELEREAQTPRVSRPCSSCRYRDPVFRHHCKHPLIVGFCKADQCNVDWQIEALTLPKGKLSSNWPHVALCGFEKALWEAKPEPQPPQSLLRRLLAWLFPDLEPSNT